MQKIMGKKILILKFYAENVCLSKHVIYISLHYLLITHTTGYFRSSFERFNFLNTALKELSPFLFDILIPGIHMGQGYIYYIMK